MSRVRAFPLVSGLAHREYVRRGGVWPLAVRPSVIGVVTRNADHCRASPSPGSSPRPTRPGSRAGRIDHFTAAASPPLRRMRSAAGESDRGGAFEASVLL